MGGSLSLRQSACGFECLRDRLSDYFVLLCRSSQPVLLCWGLKSRQAPPTPTFLASKLFLLRSAGGRRTGCATQQNRRETSVVLSPEPGRRSLFCSAGAHNLLFAWQVGDLQEKIEELEKRANATAAAKVHCHSRYYSHYHSNFHSLTLTITITVSLAHTPTTHYHYRAPTPQLPPRFHTPPDRLFQPPRCVPQIAGFWRAPVRIKDLTRTIWSFCECWCRV